MTRPGPPLLPEPGHGWQPGMPTGPSSATSSPQPASPRPARRPGRGLGFIFWGSALLAGAIACAVLCVTVLYPNINLDPTASFTRAPAPGPSNVTLEAGTTKVWLEYPAFGYGLRSEPDVRVLAPRSGTEISIRPTTSSETITRDGLDLELVGEVDIPEDGVYRVSTPDEEALRISFGNPDRFGRWFAVGLGGALLLGGLLAFAGIPLLIIGIVKRTSPQRGARP